MTEYTDYIYEIDGKVDKESFCYDFRCVLAGEEVDGWTVSNDKKYRSELPVLVQRFTKEEMSFIINDDEVIDQIAGDMAWSINNYKKDD